MNCPKTALLTEEDIKGLQKDLDASKNLLDWAVKEWNELEGITDKLKFIVKFLGTAAKISKIRKQSKGDSLLQINAAKILEAWRNIFNSDMIKNLDITLQDIKWVANVWGQKVAEGLTEADMSSLQQKSDISNRLATYLGKKWKLLQRTKDRSAFAKEYINAMKQLLRAKKAAENDDFLKANIEKLIEAWRLVLSTPVARRSGMRMQDLRMALESFGMAHGTIGQVPEKDPPQ